MAAFFSSGQKHRGCASDLHCKNLVGPLVVKFGGGGVGGGLEFFTLKFVHTEPPAFGQLVEGFLPWFWFQLGVS